MDLPSPRPGSPFSPATFADVLARQLRHNPGRPFITFYDDATGERVELSVTTYANWVAKTASLLADEHDLELDGTVVAGGRHRGGGLRPAADADRLL